MILNRWKKEKVRIAADLFMRVVGNSDGHLRKPLWTRGINTQFVAIYPQHVFMKVRMHGILSHPMKHFVWNVMHMLQYTQGSKGKPDSFGGCWFQIFGHLSGPDGKKGKEELFLGWVLIHWTCSQLVV